MGSHDLTLPQFCSAPVRSKPCPSCCASHESTSDERHTASEKATHGHGLRQALRPCQVLLAPGLTSILAPCAALLTAAAPILPSIHAHRLGLSLGHRDTRGC